MDIQQDIKIIHFAPAAKSNKIDDSKKLKRPKNGFLWIGWLVFFGLVCRFSLGWLVFFGLVKLQYLPDMVN